MTRDDARLAEMRHLTRRARSVAEAQDALGVGCSNEALAIAANVIARRAATIRAMGEEPSCDAWDADCVSDIDTALSDEPGSADVYFRAAFVGICVGAAYVALRVGGWL